MERGFATRGAIRYPGFLDELMEIVMAGLRWRFHWPVTLGALCLVALCVYTAVSLFHQQATITGVLRENVSSRRAAADLRGCLNTLIALETHHVESVADLHARAQTHLQEISEFADHPEEQGLSRLLNEEFAAYLRRWQSLPPSNHGDHERALDEATQYLEAHVLLPCREIEAHNDRRIEETTTHHEQVLYQLAWGMAVVGILGGVAGVVLGFGVARAVSLSIRRLRVQLRDAAGKLGPELPEIVVEGEGGFEILHSEIDQLTERIEHLVQKLHEREREVARAEQLAALGRLAAGVGHEIRNPLTSIKMLVQAAIEDPMRAALTDQDMRMIEQEVRRIEATLQTFLDFARPVRTEREPIDLQEVLAAVAGLIRVRAEKQKVRVTVETPPGPITVLASPGHFRQVFMNLTLNALDSMTSGGMLMIRVRRGAGQVEVEVTDTGPGIAPSMWPRLFTPFASNKETGLGLGLVISRRIVEEYGGTIRAVNRAEGGASFLVRIPGED
jgi:signal transduction histidine kinase